MADEGCVDGCNGLGYVLDLMDETFFRSSVGSMSVIVEVSIGVTEMLLRATSSNVLKVLGVDVTWHWSFVNLWYAKPAAKLYMYMLSFRTDATYTLVLLLANAKTVDPSTAPVGRDPLFQKRRGVSPKTISLSVIGMIASSLDVL